MNNEIKEMTKVLKSLGNKQASELYYYITNLQQENNNLKTSLDESQEVVIDLQQENEKLKRKLATKKLFKKYKIEKDENLELRKIFELQRKIEKTIEDIEFCLNSINQEKEMSIDVRTRNEMESCIQVLNETLNTLRGNDK